MPILFVLTRKDLEKRIEEILKSQTELSEKTFQLTDEDRDIYFIIKATYFPIDGIELLKDKLSDYIIFTEHRVREDIVDIVEETIEEYGGTLIPFTAFIIQY